MHHVGGWAFDPGSGELARGGELRRLEPRAARTLELLLAADGAVVSHERLIGEVWNGRSLSDNSVAVVIGQLRKALDDDGRTLIENVPKRGYRLRDETAGAGEGWNPGRRWWLLAALVLVIAGAVAAAGFWRGGSEPAVAILDVANETGNPALDPHARATSALLVDELARRGFAVKRGAGSADGLTMRPRLIMWNGAPSLGLTATDRGGTVRWSAMMGGGPAEVPGNVRRALAGFEEKFSAD